MIAAQSTVPSRENWGLFTVTAVNMDELSLATKPRPSEAGTPSANSSKYPNTCGPTHTHKQARSTFVKNQQHGADVHPAVATPEPPVAAWVR